MKPGSDAITHLAAKRPGARAAPWPSRDGALMPVLAALREGLSPGQLLVVGDLVWQTAPTLELLRAFNVPGREKVRPIEGYEMQLEHSGFEILERDAIDRALWTPALAADERAAVDADARGAARLAVWVVRAERTYATPGSDA